MKTKKIIEKAAKVSGAIVRTIIGIGATALLFLGIKKAKR
jgi:hypothetical protein